MTVKTSIAAEKVTGLKQYSNRVGLEGEVGGDTIELSIGYGEVKVVVYRLELLQALYLFKNRNPAEEED